jgi:prefoldin subunit 4
LRDEPSAPTNTMSSAATAAPPSAGGPSSVEVCWEDQQGICEFGRLAARRHELAAALEGKRRAAEDAAEAAAELLGLSEDEQEEDEDDDNAATKQGAAVRLLEGEGFVHYSREEAEARLGALEEQCAAEEKAAAEELRRVDARMAELKVQLYARLGRSNINLEE